VNLRNRATPLAGTAAANHVLARATPEHKPPRQMTNSGADAPERRDCDDHKNQHAAHRPWQYIAALLGYPPPSLVEGKAATPPV